MSNYVDEVMARVKGRNPGEGEFHQAVEEVLESLELVVSRRPGYRRAKIVERMVEPERVIMFRVPWMDDHGEIHINRGYRIEFSSVLGPYKGGLRFHPTVNLSILKFLGFEQVFKNSLTSLPMGGGKGGSDFDPKCRSDNEVMWFCQSFMSELYRHIGPNTDVPAGDIGVGVREIGYLFGKYRQLRNEFTGVLTGKGLGWGGSHMRSEATGYGVVYMAAEMLATRNQSLEGKICLVSGSGNVAQYTIEKINDLGGKVVTISDSSGYIYDPEGVDGERLAFLIDLKNTCRGRVKMYAERYHHATFTPLDRAMDHNPLWDHRADCAFPCATQNEIGERDAQNLIRNGVQLIAEGANMPAVPQASRLFIEHGLLYCPGKAANAGGVSVSGLEMAQNSIRYPWTREKVDDRLRLIMKKIHRTCLDTAEAFGRPGNYIHGANIGGFVKVADAMLDQGLV